MDWLGATNLHSMLCFAGFVHWNVPGIKGVDMSSRTFVLVCVALCALFCAAPHVVPLIHVLSHSWWWPAGVASMTLVTILGHLWVIKASAKSPMAFVTSVNGVTAMKLFTMLGWLTACLVVGAEGVRVFVFSLFAVFVVLTVVFVAAASSRSKKIDKK